MTPAQAAALGLTKKEHAKTLPLEDVEQRQVVQWLDLNGVKFFAVPNGGARSKKTAAKLKAGGVRAGVPDLVIVDKPACPALLHGETCTRAEGTALPWKVCPSKTFALALEMKRSLGGRLAPEQREWMLALEGRGWLCLVANGYDDAVRQLTALGYNRRTS